MSSGCLPCSRDLSADACRLGFYRLGVARVEPVDDVSVGNFRRWIEAGGAAGMDYLKKYEDLRRDPALLLDGAKSMIVCAMSYYHDCEGVDGIAMYAHGDDYHDVVRRRLESLAEIIRKRYGGETRVCVDTAPLRERYWAQRAGIGFVGVNHNLIIPGAGSWFFLGEILSTVDFQPDEPCNGSCDGCMCCVNACPNGAIVAGEGLCSERCLSYLTIENRDAIPEGIELRGNLYGCDICQRVCPHNSAPVATPVAEFHVRTAYRDLTLERVAAMSQAEFSSLFRNSAIKRTKLSGLTRNALCLLSDNSR